MLRYGLCLTAVVTMFAIPADAQAGALDTYLTNDNIYEFLEDEDYESIIDTDGNGYDEGDLFVGIFSLNTIDNTPSTPGTKTVLTAATGGVMGIIIAAVKSTSVQGNGDLRLEFRAVTTGVGSEYEGLLDGSLVPGGTLLDELPASISAGSALLVYQTTTVDVDPGTAVAGSDWDQINDGIASVTDFGTIAYELGFKESTYAAADVNPGTGLFEFRLALNVIENNIGIFLDGVTSAESLIKNLDGAALPKAQIHVTGAAIHSDDGGTVNNPQTGAFDFRTDADMVVSAYPEPGSLTLLALGALGFAGARLRRRNEA